MNLSDYLIISCFCLYQFSKACTDIRRDNGFKTRIYNLFLWIAIEYQIGFFMRWYEGGNENYNPSILGDFWHFFDNLKAYTMVVGILLAPHSEYLVISVFTGLAFSQLIFVIFYHSIFPIENESIWQAARRALIPWRNQHAQK